MARVQQGMISRLQDFTIELGGDEKADVLRLTKKGKIVRGQYSGSKGQRFRCWLAKAVPFKQWRKNFLARHNQLRIEVTSKESIALADALCKDISRRTVMPFRMEFPNETDKKVTRQANKEHVYPTPFPTITAGDVDALLELSAGQRETFSDVVEEVSAAVIGASSLNDTESLDAAKQSIHQALVSSKIYTLEQMNQLQLDVLGSLEKNERTDHSASDTKQPKRKVSHKRYRQLAKKVEQAVADKKLTLGLFRVAEDYVWKTHQGHTKPLTSDEGDQLSKAFATPLKNTRHKDDTTSLAAKRWVELGLNTAEADLHTDKTEEGKEKLSARIQELRKTQHPWALQIAKLLETRQFKEALVAEKLTVDKARQQMVIDLRDSAEGHSVSADVDQRKKAIDIITHKTPQADQMQQNKALESIQSSARFKFSKTSSTNKVINEQVPSRSSHSEYESLLAKDVISLPTSYESIPESDTDAITQTVSMLKTKYSELAELKHSARIREIENFLQQSIANRVTTPATAVTYIPREKEPEAPKSVLPPPSVSGDLVELSSVEFTPRPLSSDSRSLSTSSLPSLIQADGENMGFTRSFSVDDLTSHNQTPMKRSESGFLGSTGSLEVDEDELTPTSFLGESEIPGGLKRQDTNDSGFVTNDADGEEEEGLTFKLDSVSGEPETEPDKESSQLPDREKQSDLPVFMTPPPIPPEDTEN